MLGRFLKIVHELSAVGVMGSLAACLVLAITAPTDSLVAYAAVRQGIAEISKWLLMPSLAIVLISGLLAIAANRAYMNAAWAWIKALLGVSMFEGALLTVVGGSRRAAELSALAVTNGVGDPAQLAEIIRTEWGSLWLLLAVSFANIVLAVWRPRIYPQTSR